VIFVVLSIIVIATALLATVRAFRNRGGTAVEDNEDPALPSRVFAPAGLIPTPAERGLMAEWDKVPAELRFEKGGHHS
jgi:carbon starvation protein